MVVTRVVTRLVVSQCMGHVQNVDRAEPARSRRYMALHDVVHCVVNCRGLHVDPNTVFWTNGDSECALGHARHRAVWPHPLKSMLQIEREVLEELNTGYEAAFTKVMQPQERVRHVDITKMSSPEIRIHSDLR